MKIEVLLTKWALTGLLTKTEILYNTYDDDHKGSMMVKIATINKDYNIAYVTYRETVNPKYKNNRFKMLNADVASDLFNILGATLTELDEQF